MSEALDRALRAYILALADDEMILAHRDSEWCGHAPILEEDIAFANIALDEMGHAALWYRLLAELEGQDPERYPDQLVFFRYAPEYRNVQLVELPKGDWAFTMVRQYLVDAAEVERMSRLARSAYAPVAEVAAKILKEEHYHLRHTSAWVERLGLGTEESNCRMQRALEELWPYALQLFEPLPEEGALVGAAYVPDPAELRRAWEARVVPHLEASDLHVPEVEAPRIRDRAQHSEYLRDLLIEMQSVARAFPGVQW